MKTTVKVIAIAVLGFLAFTAATLAFAESLKSDIDSMRPDTPAEGIGRVYAEDVQWYAAGDTNAKIGTALRVWCETDENLPAWWNPSEAELVYQAAPVRDIASPDWNLNTSIVGWDSHLMEKWEFDLWVRIVYLEFWGTSQECTEAGIDSMLLLWDMGEYGRTMGELLSAQYAPGYYVYSPYAYVWNWKYDAQGLADIRAMCEERFANGPTWCAPYFRLWYYHDWATPAYEIDGVYFSVPRG